MFFLHHLEHFILRSLQIHTDIGETLVVNSVYLQMLFFRKNINEPMMMKKAWNVVTLHSATQAFTQPTTRTGRELPILRAHSRR